ncbi:MAG TPA: hypothetical protein PK668_21580 [Myxococcota bacterium]|nr:hypothetical protein [Myxococcota bacterium]HRY96070.1 hypothetical protein [Myxococcota bacterium]
MAYRRQASPPPLLTGDDLTRSLAGIGMAFAAAPSPDPNVEDTLLAASVEGMERDDLRVLAVLLQWLEVYQAWIHADRLIRAVSAAESPRVKAFWAAIGRWLGKDRRFARLQKVYRGPRLDLLRQGTAFQVRRRGEDPRFEGTPLRVPAGILRQRASDVHAPEDLVKRQPWLRFRILMGPSYRADMWAALTREPALTAAELARRTYGSFATAWGVKKDFGLLG